MKTLLILALSLTSITASAQNIQGSYQPKADGQVKKQEAIHQELTATGEGIVWDLSAMEVSDKGYVVKYSQANPDGSDSIVAGTERHTRYYYCSTPDSVMLCGYEDHLTKVQYDRPELLLHLPLTLGSRHENLFHGTMAYCEKMFLRICGSCQVEVDGTGAMLLPGGDTLRHVSRVHIRRLATQQHYPHITTQQALKSYVDSIAPYTADSIRRQLLTADSLLTETNTFRWYAAGYRYPVLETVSVGRRGSTPSFIATYYCSPEEQEQQSDDENEAIRQLLAEADRPQDVHDDTWSHGTDGNGKKALPAALSDLSVSVSGKTVTIDYTLTEDATLRAMVCGASGILYRQQSQTGQAGGTYRQSINCSGLRRGEYVVYLNVNGEVTSSAVSL